MAKKKVDDENDLDFIPDNNKRPLTPEELAKIELKKRVKELREKSRDQVQVIVTKAGEVKRVDNLTIQERKEEYTRCALDPVYFIETYLTVFDQTKGESGEIVPFKLFDFQKVLIKAFQKNKQNIANKYRQAGVSTTTCAYITWYVMFNDNRYVAVVADKLETARDELLSDIIDFIECCPNYLKPKIASKDTAHHKRYKNGSQMKAFAATKLRGPTPTLIFWDETAWTEKGDMFWTSAAPSVRNTGGRTIFVSTPNGLDAVFYATFDMATRNENDFNAIELWWYNDPRYNKGLYWVKNENKENEFKVIDEDFSFEKRKQFVADGFKGRSAWYEEAKRGYNGNLRKLAQEVECSFLGSGDNFVAEEYVKRIEDKELKVPIAEEWEDKGVWIWEHPLPKVAYVITNDVSSGHGDDFSTVHVLKHTDITEEINIVEDGILTKKKIQRRKIEQVMEYYGKVTPQGLAEIIYFYGVKYNNAHCVVDVSGGYGVSTIEKLMEYGYKNIHYSEIQHKPTRDRLSNYVKTGQKEVSAGVFVKVDLIPGFMIGNNRAMVLQEFERSVRMEDVVIRSRRLTSEMKTFVTVAGPRLADHKRSFHDDAIMGISIGIYVISFDLFKSQQNTDKLKAMLDSIMVVGAEGAQPDEIKRREAMDVRPHSANPYGQHSWMFKNLKGS